MLNYIKKIFSPAQSHLTYDTVSSESASHHTSSPTPFKLSLSNNMFPNLNFSTFSIHPNHQISTSFQTSNSYTTLLLDTQKNAQFVYSAQYKNMICKFTTLLSQEIFSSFEIDIKNKTNSISVKNVHPAIKNTNLIVVNFLQNINKNLSVGTEVILSKAMSNWQNINPAFAARYENNNKILVMTMQSSYINISLCKKINEMLSWNIENTINNGISGRLGIKVKSKKAEARFEIDSELKSRINYTEQILGNMSLSLDGEIDRNGKMDYGMGLGYSI
ncbi:hypothetical protein BDAP_002860 [Binucleata daphniae]